MLRLLSSGEKLNLERFYPYKIVNEILEDLKAKIAEKNQSLEIIFDNKNMYIEADIALMKQCLFNIINNAVRYSKNGAKIEIKQNDKILRVKNYGVGISADNLEKIFEAFYCVDKSRSKKIGGSGLELAITKEIVERHGFFIRAESVSDRFVEFIIDFNKKYIEDVKVVEKR